MSKQSVTAKDKKPNRYAAIIEKIFLSRYKAGDTDVDFERAEFESFAEQLGIQLPKNLGDIIYSFRYRTNLPSTITSKAPKDHVWIIRPIGRGKYRMIVIKDAPIVPNLHLEEIKVPDSTPGVVAMYSLDDEQALLARVRYNRLIDIFTGVTCYSLQNHLRTTVPEMGQVETDEIYIGLNRHGAHYVFPIQAKGGTDRLNIVQIEQDLALCAAKFPGLSCTAIGAQFITKTVGHYTIALFGFEKRQDGPKMVLEKHYRLVSPKDISKEDLEAYRNLALAEMEILKGPAASTGTG